MNRKYHTDFLFPDNSFVIGMASTFDVFGNFFVYNTSKTDNIADVKAIQCDWGIVGEDLLESINEQQQ
jgi:hypothetical protein